MKRLLLFLPVLLIIAIGCDDMITDSISNDDSTVVQSADALNESAFGKKNDNGNGNDKGGGKPGGGGDAFPTYSNITVTQVNSLEAVDWYDDSIMTVPSLVTSYIGVSGPEAFFGCPDDSLPCYKMSVKLDQVDTGDAVAVRIYPFEEDKRCALDGCPRDLTLDDGTTNPPRRKLSLFDDYLGTPYVTVEEFEQDGTYSFYWQRQALRSYFNPSTGSNEAAAYYRVDRDPDDGGADLLRAQAVFIDASSPGTFDGASMTDIDYCASASPSATDNSDCVFRFEGAANADLAIESNFLSLGEATRSRGRNKGVSTEILVDNTLGGVSQVHADGGSDVWVVYLVDNILVNGARVRTVKSTSNNSFTVSPEEGCLLIRPIQAELFANSSSEFDSAFSADSGGFEEVFSVGPYGELTQDSSCIEAF